MSDVGKKLREERDRKHLTQVQVFTKTGINNKTLSGYENEVSHPDFETLKLLAELYEVTTDYLLGMEAKEGMTLEILNEADQKFVNDFIKMDKSERDKYKNVMKAIKGE